MASERLSATSLARLSISWSISSSTPSRKDLPTSWPAVLTSAFLDFVPLMSASVKSCPAWKFCLNAQPCLASVAKALAALRKPLMPCSWNTFTAAMMPRNGARMNSAMALPTPAMPLMTCWMSPLPPMKADTFWKMSTRYVPTFSSTAERNSPSGLNTARAALIPFMASSSSLRLSLSFIARLTISPRTARKGVLERASKPSFTPLRRMPAALPKLSTPSFIPLKASLTDSV